MSKDNLWKKLHPLLGETRTSEIRHFIETTGSLLDEEAYNLTETEEVIIVASTKFKDYVYTSCAMYGIPPRRLTNTLCILSLVARIAHEDVTLKHTVCLNSGKIS